jgi:Ca-activated chloride channel family protein
VKRLVSVLFIIIAAAGSAASAQPPAAQPPQTPTTPAAPVATFKSATELVALNVTVVDQQQNYVAGLAESDFAVFEDGVKQDVSFFASSQIPLDLIVLIDASASMLDKMAVAQEAALGFVRTLRQGDRAAIVAFNDGTRVLQPLTANLSELETAIRSTQPSGATALHNAIYVALREFGRAAKQSGEVRRQAIAVCSDGEDTASLISFDDVLEQARRSGVSIYTISLQSRTSIAQRAVGRHRYFSQSEYSMKTLAQDTGGQAFFPARIQELSGVYGRIAAELGSQYSLAYAPKNIRKDGRFRRVIVQILTRPDARPRTRTGYVSETTRGAVSIVGARDPQ